MAYAYNSHSWDIKHPLFFTILRVFLGLILTIRGVYFFINEEPLYYLIKDSHLNELHISMQIAVLISIIHLAGGIFMITGLFTKIAAWVQVPVVLGAVIFINKNNSLSFTYPGLLISLFVLALLLLFAFKGGGEISVDGYAEENLL